MKLTVYSKSVLQLLAIAALVYLIYTVRFVVTYFLIAVLISVLTKPITNKLSEIKKISSESPYPDSKTFELTSYGLLVGMISVSFCSISISLLYGEFVWWLFGMSICLKRAVENFERDKKIRQTNI